MAWKKPPICKKVKNLDYVAVLKQAIRVCRQQKIDFKTLRFYQCDICGFWHFTRMSKRKLGVIKMKLQGKK